MRLIFSVTFENNSNETNLSCGDESNPLYVARLICSDETYLLRGPIHLWAILLVARLICGNETYLLCGTAKMFSVP